MMTNIVEIFLLLLCFFCFVTMLTNRMDRLADVVNQSIEFAACEFYNRLEMVGLREQVVS